MDKRVYQEYIAILREEIVPALGCTEPIAIAYGAAAARETLGQMPERMIVHCSGNIINNVKAVVVPHTGSLKGIETSAIQIHTFANEVRVCDIDELMKKQIDANMRIALEGLSHPYGVNVGETLINAWGTDFRVLARALPAAGSDARMNGCVLPVMTNSGSGNQGMTVSLPVVVYAKHLKVAEEKMMRALVLSNLIAVYQKKSSASSALTVVPYLQQRPVRPA